ncbi:MAG: alpha/beta fold hydrolase [Planctomycetaceae bacterium]|nr:alpha/beta fold hydrolase [Planctomycetaceae bacterium]
MFPTFEPARWVRNPHLQTIWSSLFKEPSPPYQANQHRVTLSDGDQIVLHDDVPEQWRDGDPIVLLSHGLTGCHQSAYVVRMTTKLNERGYRTFRIDLRNCGAGFGLAQLPYHAGRSSDLLESLEFIHQQAPHSPISLVGYSLSGNIVLRTIAENPDQLPEYLVTAVAVNPPVDLYRSVLTLNTWMGRIYDRHFTRQLIDHLRRLRQQAPEQENYKLSKIPRTMYEFDNVYTAPMAGYDSAKHYYAETSAIRILPQIQLPSLVLTANDDPLIPVEMFDGLKKHDAVTLFVAPHGGHLGYRGRPGSDPDQHWMDWRILEWLEKNGRSCSNKLVSSFVA